MAIGNEMMPLMTVAQSMRRSNVMKDSGKKLTKEPSPSGKTSVTVESIVDTGLQKSTEDWRD